jgi:hypothetical protein
MSLKECNVIVLKQGENRFLVKVMEGARVIESSTLFEAKMAKYRANQLASKYGFNIRTGDFV